MCKVVSVFRDLTFFLEARENLIESDNKVRVRLEVK